MARVAIVAAMFREVHPLVRDMQPFKYLPDKRVQIYQSDDAVVAYAGMGKQQAEVACRAALATGEISAIVSAGWAGGLNAQVAAGKVVEPATVIDALTHKRYAAGGNRGTLVTVQLVAGLDEKRRLAEQYGGDYVDMEAAAVAECAREVGLPFYCFKAISDAQDARLPDMNRFNRNGRFSVWRFVGYIAIRPTLWSVVSEMSRASLDSRDAMCKRLKEWIASRKSVSVTELGKPI
jgi:adenosylhomocysteine nucleosidase